MIDWEDFERAVISNLDRDISRQRNQSQNDAIRSALDQSLFIVAGPGSGKTTVIALRVLKLIFVDAIDPINILATTFTRKAAAELRSRILSWGDQLRRVFIHQSRYSRVRSRLKKLDFNRIVIGTLDSIAEEILGEYRAPGTPPPIVIEDFVSNALMIRVGLFNHGRFRNSDLRDYLIQLNGGGYNLVARNYLIPRKASEMLCSIKDRIYHDQVDINRFRNNPSHPGIPILCDAINDYNLELQNRLFFDFARLEHEFLAQLRGGVLNRFLQDIRFILVDEYQDTNLLQEQIYFELMRAALRNGGSATIVGDDDQSLYRFRGATVDLFQAFVTRINRSLGIRPRIIYLSKNYRSTPNIVNFCNEFITLDAYYQHARVAQDKPPITPMRPQPYTNYQILGMFRNDVNQLSSDLAEFIHRVIYGGGVQIQDRQGNQHTIEVAPQRQNRPEAAGDIVLLCSSPREFDTQRRPRLPLLLRNELSQLSPPIQVFNPRGENLELINEIQILCGLILECIDPNSNIQDDTSLPQIVKNIFNTWRTVARGHIESDPQPNNPRSLGQFVEAWQRRSTLGRRIWEREIPLIDLVYKLVTWIPAIQNDIEGLVYLESITRVISQAGLFGSFGGQIIFDQANPNLEEASIREILWNILMPIATGAIEIDENLLETLPPDRLNIMSIHQAKGLEFPLVIVDVGSDFRTDHHAHAFKRFPRNGGRTCNIEDELRSHSPLGQPQRVALDRAFDDLIRHYFVAFSRAKDVLLLVGLDSVKNGYETQSNQRMIPNIATGWDRNRNWQWGRGLPNLVHI